MRGAVGTPRRFVPVRSLFIVTVTVQQRDALPG